NLLRPLQPAMKTTKDPAIPKVPIDILKDDDTPPADPTRLLQDCPRIGRVMEDENQQDDIKTVVCEGKTLAIEEHQRQRCPVEVVHICGNNFTTDLLHQQLVEQAIAGPDVQDTVFRLDEGLQPSQGPASAVLIDTSLHAVAKSFEHRGLLS